MAGSAVRFLQASDLDLHRPLCAISRGPAGLRQDIAEAPYLAAERVFDTAIAERVDFVLLAGNTCDPRHVGARGLVFLARQFERLDEQDIPVFWCHGHEDRANRWPAAMKWPDNLHRFSTPAPEAHYFTTAEGRTVEIIGSSWTRRTVEPAASITPGGDGTLTIALTGGKITCQATEGKGPHYWALGGSKGRTSDDSDGSLIHWAGSPQGRGPGETGAHGCTIVEVNAELGFDLQHVDCDCLRWIDDDLVVEGNWLRDNIQQALAARAGELCSINSDRLIAVTWDLGSVPASILDHRLRPTSASWQAEVRGEMERDHPNLVVAGLHWNTPFDEGSFEEDSLRGSFLRCLRSLLDEKKVAMILGESVPGETPAELAKQLSNDDAATIAMLVDEVASLGDSLLDGAERPSGDQLDKPEAA